MDTQRIQSCVENWHLSQFKEIRYFYLYDYVPISCGFDVPQNAWDTRHLVWNFKFDRNKRITESQHNCALDILIPKFEELLQKTFKECVSELTLVCIGASTRAINKDRYEVFSDRLCKKLNMINAYSHIRVVRDRVAKREGGELRKGDIEFDKTFFEGKRILLFDDVFTSGLTMARYAVTLVSFGATVIGGITIAKTKH